MSISGEPSRVTFCGEHERAHASTDEPGVADGHRLRRGRRISGRRSRARNIASVPWRCGHSWTVGPSPRSGMAGGSGAGVEQLGRRRRPAPPRIGLHDVRPSRAVRRAGRVGDDPAGPHQAQRAGEQLALQLRERLDVRRADAATAPRVGGAARPGRCRGRRAAPGRRSPAAAAGGGCPRRPPGRRARRRAGRAAWCSSSPTTSSPRAASSAALPPGPAARSMVRGPGASTAASASATSWLPSSCTAARPSRTAASSAGIAAGGQPDRERRPRARARRPSRGGEQLVAGHAAGDEVDLGPRVVACEGAPGLVPVRSVRGDPRASAKASTIQRGWAQVIARCPAGSSSNAGRRGRRRRRPRRRGAARRWQAGCARGSMLRTRSTVVETAARAGTRVRQSW